MKCAEYDIKIEDGLLRALKLIEDRLIPYLIENCLLNPIKYNSTYILPDINSCNDNNLQLSSYFSERSIRAGVTKNFIAGFIAGVF